MKYRLTIPSDLWLRLDSHLQSSAPEEDGAFVLARSGLGQVFHRFVGHELLLPATSNAWEARGKHQLRPSGRWLSAAIGAAIETNSALVFIHSHPHPDHPAQLSPIDQATSSEWARSIAPTIDNPLLSLVWTPRSVNGLVFDPRNSAIGNRLDVIEVVGAGRRIVVSGTGAFLGQTAAVDDRQVRAVGFETNIALRDLTVTIVGAGGTGSPLAEQLTRMGIASITILDPEVVDSESNIRRLSGSRWSDYTESTPKTAIATRHLMGLQLGTNVTGLNQDVRSEAGVSALIDSDIAVVATDTHSSRAFVNQVAYQYWLPVVDVGLVVGTTMTGDVSGMPIEVRTLLPDTGCLLCRGTLDARQIRAENLPIEELTDEMDRGYVQGVGGPAASITSLNVLAASLAALTVVQLASRQGVTEPHILVDPWQLYVQRFDAQVDPDCLCSQWRGQGGNVQVPPL